MKAGLIGYFRRQHTMKFMWKKGMTFLAISSVIEYGA
jgi:hypothetical protein